MKLHVVIHGQLGNEDPLDGGMDENKRKGRREERVG
jgi:hypothetical protein